MSIPGLLRAAACDAASRLADDKVPRVVEFVDELPLTAGKIQKVVLRQRVQKGS